MLSGEVSYRHADQDYHLKPGDSMLFDQQALHGPAKLFKKPMTRLSAVVHPQS